MAYRSLGEIDKAREVLGKRGQGKIRLHDPRLQAIGTLTVSSEMFITAGAQAIKTGRLEDAEQAYRGAIALNPDNPRPHVNLAELLTRRGAYDEAEASAREALRLEPTSFFANFNLGNIFEQQGRFDEAAEFFAKALDKDPGSVKANHRYAGIMMKTGNYSEAATLYKIAAELAPAFSAARYLQVLALVAQEKYDDALEVAEVAVEISPDDLNLRSTLARLLAVATETSDSAERAFAIGRDLFDQDPTAENVETIAMALAALGKYQEAVSAQLSVIEAAREAGDTKALAHLEYNLDRYRSGLRSDRPWQLIGSAE
jgi:tetratricopeptide (TPR) repeat protein